MLRVHFQNQPPSFFIDVPEKITKDWIFPHRIGNKSTVPIDIEEFKIWNQLARAAAENDYSMSVPLKSVQSILEVIKPAKDYHKWSLFAYITDENEFDRQNVYEEVGEEIRISKVRLPYNKKKIPLTGKKIPPLHGNFGLDKDPAYQPDANEDVLTDRTLNCLTGILHNAYIRTQLPDYEGEKYWIELPRDVIDWKDLVTFTYYPRILLTNYEQSNEKINNLFVELNDDLAFSDISILLEKDTPLAGNVRLSLPDFSDRALAHDRITRIVPEKEKYRTMPIGIVVAHAHKDTKHRYNNVYNVIDLYSEYLTAILTSVVMSLDNMIEVIGISHLVKGKFAAKSEKSNYFINADKLVSDVNERYITGDSLNSAIVNGISIIGEDNMYEIGVFLLQAVINNGTHPLAKELLKIGEVIASNIE